MTDDQRAALDYVHREQERIETLVRDVDEWLQDWSVTREKYSEYFRQNPEASGSGISMRMAMTAIREVGRMALANIAACRERLAQDAA